MLDGKALMFTSFRRTGEDDLGIYLSFKHDDGRWSPPRSVGDTINEGGARFPGLSPDGSLLFFTSLRSGNEEYYWVDASVLDDLEPAARPATEGWYQWGGPNRDFTVNTEGLATEWPKDGPKRLWHRELGVGYSGIVSDGETLYTMYRTSVTDDEERTIALDAKTGKMIWEHRNSTPASDDPDSAWGGQGPNSTPLISGDRLYAIGSSMVMHAFDRRTGKVLWTHDPVSRHGAVARSGLGYSVSPVVYGDTIIVAVGTEEPNESSAGRSLVALDQRTGRVVWKSLDFRIKSATPILTSLRGRDQLVLPVRGAILGIDPADGTQLWRQPMGASMPSPLRVDDERVFVAIGADGSSGHLIHIEEREQQLATELQWSSDSVDVYLATPVLSGEMIVGSSKTGVMGVDSDTGEELWFNEELESAWCLLGDETAIFLDMNGELAVATVSRQELKIHARHRITEKYSLTAPTLVGTTLYVRDRKNIMALDLGELQ